MFSPPRSFTEILFHFPHDWTWLVDEGIPSLVKEKYSQKESWKKKPFSREDARFYFRGIEELSSLFTDERPRGMPAYLQHPKFRSAYLLYFVPLQAAKFLTLFEIHKEAMQEALAHGRKEGVLRLLDLGAGPATASLATLLWFAKEKDLPPIEITLVDTQGSTLKDGEALVLKLAERVPALRGKVKVVSEVRPWWEATRLYKSGEQVSLILMGHVLNEASGPAPQAPQRDKWQKTWENIFDLSAGGGILMVDLASRKTAQILSTLRDEFFEAGLARSLWGPCLHCEICPLREGRDWCHFSMPTKIPGKWFKGFSEGLGSERQWLKMSYLWLADPRIELKKSPANLRRVISDPLGEHKNFVLLCEPERPGKYALKPRQRIFRGDLIRLH